MTGGCTSTTEEFEVTEPTQLSIPQPSACGTTITAQASGGTPNYSYTLRNLTTNQSYPSNLGAIPGAVVFDSTGKVQVGELFRVDAIDANGCVVQSIGNTMPGALEITDANVKVVNDYCNENPDIGFGSIILDSGGQLAVSGGSNNYTYSWSGPNGYTNSTMNINNLAPGVYNLTVTDNVFANCIVQNSYTVLGSDPLDLAPTAGNAPNAVTGVSTNTAVDQKITLNCNSTALVLEVQASGGINNNYIYNWDRNGTAIGGNGNQLTVDPPVSGIYNVEVSLDISALDPPFGYSQNDLICTNSYSFEVVIPAEMSVVEDTNKRIVPACPGDFAQLVFNVNGGADGSGPYTVQFDNGLSGTSAGPSNREIIITGIDTSNHNTFSGYTVSGGDPSCTKAGVLPSQITLPNYNEIDIQATPQDIDCSTSQEGKIEFSYNGNPDLNTLSIQIKSPVLNYNYFNTWQNLSSGAGNATVDIDQAGTYEYTIFGTPVSGATSNTNICELDSGTVEVLDSANSQILLLAVNAQDPPCDEDTGGSIELVIDETTITPQMSIKWQKLTLTTSTVSASTSSLSTATTEITTQDWQYVPSLEGNLSVQNLVKGSYRAIIRSNNEGNCANNEITTSTQVIGGRGFELLNLRYLDAPAADSSVSECSVDNIRYNIEFTLANEKINGGNIEITVNKTGGDGVGYSEIFNSSNASSDTAKITWPLTSDRSGNYRIKSVPFGDYEIKISETGGATDTCELNQILIIPGLEEISYIGDMSYTLDKCDPEFELTAEIQGGVPFVSSNGEPFYKYNWQLNSDEFGVLEYTGKTITVKYPGEISLTVQDSKGCIVDITSTDKIQVRNEISRYYLEEGLSLVTNGVTPTTTEVYALEPSCADAERDDGKIKFNVKGVITLRATILFLILIQFSGKNTTPHLVYMY